MINSELIELFKNYLETDYKEGDIWKLHSEQFKKFWNDKILNNDEKSLSDEEIDPIIRLLDQNGKGNTKNDISVAKTFIRMGMWYRVFKSLKDNDDIKNIFSKIINESDEKQLIDLINKLEDINKKYKNGLTGKNGVIINAILFLNKPPMFISAVSLAHRELLLKYFKFGDIENYNTFGEKIILSNKLLLEGFKNIGLDGSPRSISCFLYAKIKNKWHIGEIDSEEEELVSENTVTNENIFTLEKFFEDFLIGNWESTELGKKFDLIMENGELVSQQYKTDIGRIDLLVKEKKSNNYVVIELKRGQTTDDTVGQLTRYMGWVKKNLCKNGEDIKGIIIGHDYDEKLKYSLSMVKNTELLLYKISFNLLKPDF